MAMQTTPEQKQLIEEIMRQLKLQKDRKSEVVTRGSTVINPQLLTTNNPSTYGPFYFEAKFSKNPFITFGQVRLDNQKGLLIVQPYIDNWIVDSGNINGFNLGVFALTRVPAGLLRHTVTWQAAGRSSLYKADNRYDNWSGAYNNRQAQHLSFDDGMLPKPG